MSGEHPPVHTQQAFWNEWNAATREKTVERVSLEQAEVIMTWLQRLGRSDLRIIDVGCGAGWLCSRLTRFGEVTGTDLSDQVLERAKQRAPKVAFIAGDFMALDLGTGLFDVAVTLEVLSHVPNQAIFLARISQLLRPGGWLMLATQNRPALQRNAIPPPRPGQLRRWVDRHELAQLLEPEFRLTEMFSITPCFNRGPLRIVNSARLQRLLAVLGLSRVRRLAVRMQEKAWLGWTLMALAEKRPRTES